LESGGLWRCPTIYIAIENGHRNSEFSHYLIAIKNGESFEFVMLVNVDQAGYSRRFDLIFHSKVLVYWRLPQAAGEINIVNIDVENP
jgi:hypothetical protein